MLGLKSSASPGAPASPIAETRHATARPPTGRYGSMLHHSRKLQAHAQAQLVAAGVLRKSGDQTTWDLTKTDLGNMSQDDGASVRSEASSQYSHPLRISQPKVSMPIEPSPIIESATLRERQALREASPAARAGPAHALAYFQRMAGMAQRGMEGSPSSIASARSLPAGGSGGSGASLPDFLRDDWAYYHRDRRMGGVPSQPMPHPSMPHVAEQQWLGSAGYMPMDPKAFVPRSPVVPGGQLPPFMMPSAPPAAYPRSSMPYDAQPGQYEDGSW